MRVAPLAAPESVPRKAQHSEERKYQFLTYVFGGGVKIREHEKPGDPITPVRVASIRGQLRFWWRACNPSHCETMAELRQREGEIWGTTSRASKVEVVLDTKVSKPGAVPCFKYNDKQRLVPCTGMREIAYGAFPFAAQPRRAESRRKALGSLRLWKGDLLSPFHLSEGVPGGCASGSLGLGDLRRSRGTHASRLWRDRSGGRSVNGSRGV